MSQSEDTSGAGWWNGWIQTAKEKSTSVFELVKHDLAEFTSTMHEDGSKVAATVKEKLTQENATAATQKVKEGVSSLLGGISKALVIAADDDYQLAQIVGGKAVVFDRYKARMHAIQTDPTTYTTEPSPADSYRDWQSSFDIESFKGNISELLVSSVEVRALYTQLVPVSVTNLDFWSRYYFCCRQLDEEEARRVELMRRADEVQGQKEMGWDEDEDDEWTEVSTSQLQQQADADTQSRDDISGTIETSSTVIVPSSRSDAEDSQHTADDLSPDTASVPADSCSDDVTTAPTHSSPPDHSPDPASDPASDQTPTDSLHVVMVTPERTSPSDESSTAKESLDEDWEKDFDVEVTEQELEAAKERLKNASTASPVAADTGKAAGDDWEDW